MCKRPDNTLAPLDTRYPIILWPRANPTVFSQQQLDVNLIPRLNETDSTRGAQDLIGY